MDSGFWVDAVGWFGT